MNSYGYDYYISNDNSYTDETPYLDTLKPLNQIENFENDVESLLNDPNLQNNEALINNEALKKNLDKKTNICNIIYDNFQKCKSALQIKNYEFQQMSNQIFLLYILLIFAVMFIFYQKININNLYQMIYILKYNKKNIV